MQRMWAFIGAECSLQRDGSHRNHLVAARAGVQSVAADLQQLELVAMRRRRSDNRELEGILLARGLP